MIFLASQAVTLFGSTLVQMAIVWYVTLNTGEGAWIAAFTVASYLPQFLISFLGGVWADRFLVLDLSDVSTDLCNQNCKCLEAFFHFRSENDSMCLRKHYDRLNSKL